MKKLSVLLLVISLAFNSCKKQEVATKESSKDKEYKLSYEVITSSGKWFGEYHDQNGQKIQTSPLELNSGWRYDIKTTKVPFQMFINATSSCSCFDTPTSPDVTINLYIDDVLVKTEKNTWAKGVASVVYDL